MRAVSPSIFEDDPLRLLRAVRLEDELGFAMDAETESLLRTSAPLVTRAAGERILAELLRLSPAGYRRLAEVGLLAELGGALDDRLDALDDPDFRLVAALRENLVRLPVSNELAGTRPCSCAPARPTTRPRARSTASEGRPSRGPSTRSRSSAPPSSRGRRGRPPRGPGGAARPRRRARPAARARDRAYPRGHRGGAGQRGRSRRARTRSPSLGTSPRRRRRHDRRAPPGAEEERASDLAQRVRRLLGPFLGDRGRARRRLRHRRPRLRARPARRRGRRRRHPARTTSTPPARLRQGTCGSSRPT